ncbi:site-specific integrase [Parabacteroides sp.]|uniref:tyrosine-type recombinase/integrase n=1 Tax=Parabacteroides sp. TaxID=1869337 RepID=UPI00258011F7|nr:site-specific integrase [Parabacteroides sp.]
MRKEEDFVTGLLVYIVRLREKKRYSTAKSYQDALNSFKCFCGMEAIPYTYINRNRLLCYQSWLLDKGCSLNTVSTYMRRIRHIYNLAVEADGAPFVPNLFKDVFTGVESRRKKALPANSLRSLMGTPRVEPEMRRTQLSFCLMFSFSGMAFVDFAHLRRDNIKDGVLSYHRQKSGSLIQVEIPAEVRLLLDELAACTDKDSPYLFPFLSGKQTGEAAYGEYNKALCRFNRSLRSLATTCGVGEPVTSYTIRHSFATALREREVPIDVISELLGHKSIKTTQVYLKSFSLERLSAVNRACFESVYKTVSGVG